MTHQVTSRLNVMASGYKILRVEPLPADEALARGINFVSESFVFGVAGAVLVFEYQRSEAKAAAKAQQTEEENRRYQEYLDDKFQNLYREIKTITSRLDDIETRLEEQEKQRGRWLLGIGGGSTTSHRINTSTNDRKESAKVVSRTPATEVPASSSSPTPTQTNPNTTNIGTTVNGMPSDGQSTIGLESHSPPAVIMIEETEINATEGALPTAETDVLKSTKVEDDGSTVVSTPPTGYWSSWYRWRLW